jgi:hypothetical protein
VIAEIFVIGRALSVGIYVIGHHRCHMVWKDETGKGCFASRGSLGETRKFPDTKNRGNHWNPSSTAWICTESILAFFGRGSQCELQKAFRQQLREAAAIGRWETDWKAQIKYTVFLGSAEFVAQMRKLLSGDRDHSESTPNCFPKGIRIMTVVPSPISLRTSR